MVGTFDTVAFHFAEGQRHPAMGANVAHGSDCTLRCFANEDREVQQDGPLQAAGSEFTAEASGIPKAEQWRAFGWLDLGDEVAVHGKHGMGGYIDSSWTISGVLSEVKVIALTRKRSGDYSQNPVEIAKFMRA
jgi:hypothetical protein